MFSGFDSNKKREKSRKDPAVGISGGDQKASAPTGAYTSGQDPREMGGVTIQEYSKAQRIPEPEAWRQLRRGELVGRTFEGRLYVFTNVADTVPEHMKSQLSATINELIADEPTAVNEPLEAKTEKTTFQTSELDPLVEETLATKVVESNLPPLPGIEREFSFDAAPRSGGSATAMLPVATERVTNTELALLLDHLSLAKEENREILKMTQESIRKVTELTETIVEMKDSVIEAKDTQIMFLKDQLETREKEIRKLLQQKEDLEILAQTIISTQQPEKPR